MLRKLIHAGTEIANGALVIIAGRPSMGKTSFAINIAEHAAIMDNLSVAIFSMEMSGCCPLGNYGN